jgi:hypothetical protein
MANSRFYSSTAQATTLTSGITAGSPTMDVAATTGFPGSFPYTLSVDYGAAAEELVTVIAAAGLTLTITRGEDGTSAQSHSSGAVIKHVASAQDFTDSRTHEAASTNVHGLTGGAAVVGTTQSQTLSSKTISGGTFTGTIAGSPTFSGTPSFGNAGLTGTLTASGSATLAGTFAGSPTLSGAVSLTGAVSHTGASMTANELTVTNNATTDIPLVVNAITSTTAKLASLQVNAVEKFAVDNGGVVKAIGDVTESTLANIATAASGFSVVAGYAIRRAGMDVVQLVVQRTGGTITSTNGNITDTDICTVASAWRPASGFGSEALSFSYGTGVVNGELVTTPSTGVTTIRTASSDVTTGSNIRFTLVYPAGTL